MPYPKNSLSFERSSATQTVVDWLLTMGVGDLASYADVANLIGVDDALSQTTALQSALRIVENEHRRVFVNVPGEGYRRADDKQVIAAATKQMKKIRRAAFRGSKKLDVVDENKLSAADRVMVIAKRSLLSMVRTTLHPARVEKAQARHDIAKDVAAATRALFK